MNKFLGIEYGRAATAKIVMDGPALGPRAVRDMFPNAEWTFVTADAVDAQTCMADRFGDAFAVHQKTYAAVPRDRHIMIGGDHSVNFGHFAAIADQFADTDVCLVYIDAHLDIHTPESSIAQASGAPHGTNVRALLGDGDARWLGMQKKCPALKPENLFYLATRSYEPAEIECVRNNNIWMRTTDELKTPDQWAAAVQEIRARIGNRPFVVSFDFDAIDPAHFTDVLVPEPNGISVDAAEFLTHAFKDAHSFEFVEYAPRGDKNTADLAKKLIGIVANQ
ncbi:MAG: arginase family protein [Alphaproteobacteria bacterium]|nr:arginase family protein [Alphaproteobacteria bacterium]